MGSVSAAAPDLTGLFSIFGGSPSETPQARFVTAADTPEPYRKLLAHHHHMTVTMEQHIGAPVTLEVMQAVLEGEWYARKILLRDSRSGKVVQFGLMRFNFQWCDPKVRELIIEGKTPLGRILIEHDILRRISTHALMRIEPNHEMREVFELKVSGSGSGSTPVYGRLATIFCNEQPAIDLLEVAAPGL